MGVDNFNPLRVLDQDNSQTFVRYAAKLRGASTSVEVGTLVRNSDRKAKAKVLNVKV